MTDINKKLIQKLILLQSSEPFREISADERPFFIYNFDQLQENIQVIRKAFRSVSSQIQFKMSVKSLPHPRIIQELSCFIDGFDISSLAELRLLQELGINLARVSATGPGKNFEFLEQAAQWELGDLQIDSREEFELARGLGLKNLSLRVQEDKLFSEKLGMSKSVLQEIFSDAKKAGIRFRGLHSYLGRDSFTPELFHKSCERLTKIIEKNRNVFSDEPKIFIGPGLPGDFVESLRENEQGAPALSRMDLPDSLPVDLEIGRALMASIGLYGARILARKILNSRQEILIINGGLQHLGSPYWSMNRPPRNFSMQCLSEKSLEEEVQEFVVSGSLCLGHDILSPRVSLPRNIQAGDWLLFPSSGAYGLTAGVPYFIGQDLPREFVFDQEQISEVTLERFRLYHETVETRLKTLVF